MSAVQKFIQSQNTGSAVDIDNGNVYVIGSNDAAINTDTVQFLSDLNPALLVTLGVAVPSPTFINRTFNGGQIDFGGAPSAAIRAFCYYYNTGVSATSRLIYVDNDGPFFDRFYDPKPAGYFQL